MCWNNLGLLSANAGIEPSAARHYLRHIRSVQLHWWVARSQCSGFLARCVFSCLFNYFCVNANIILFFAFPVQRLAHMHPKTRSGWSSRCSLTLSARLHQADDRANETRNYINDLHRTRYSAFIPYISISILRWSVFDELLCQPLHVQMRLIPSLANALFAFSDRYVLFDCFGDFCHHNAMQWIKQ